MRERLLRVARILEGANVPYAVAEGNAVAAWVSRVDEAAVRNTRDVDILLRRKDLEAARDAFEKAGFVYRRVSSLGKSGQIDLFLDGPKASARDAVHVIFAAEKVRGESPVPSPGVEESGATGFFRVVTLQALVRMKLAAFRDKDRMHLRDLIEVGLVDETWLRPLMPELRARLKEILDSPED